MKTYNFIHMLEFNITIYWHSIKKFEEELDILCKQLRLEENDNKDFYYIEYLAKYFEELDDAYNITISIRNDHKNKLTDEWLDKLQQLYDKYNKA